MTATMKSVNYGTGAPSVFGQAADISGLVLELQKISQHVAKIAERPPADIRVPFPEIHNEFIVPTQKVDVYPSAVENVVTVNPTPIEVLVSAPHVDNHVRCDPVMTVDVKGVVTSLYVLSGVLLVSSLGIITAILLR